MFFVRQLLRRTQRRVVNTASKFSVESCVVADMPCGVSVFLKKAMQNAIYVQIINVNLKCKFQ